MTRDHFIARLAKAMCTGLALCAGLCAGTGVWQSDPGRTGWAPCGSALAGTQEDRAASATAFAKAARVLQHPRCVNCHPAGERPLVGDRSVPHPMQVVRGPQGMGKNGLWCSTCHQEKNLHGQELPPGAPEWQLPPADLPMVFEGRSPQQLCEQLKDPAQNGGRSPDEIVEHVREAPLVLWGWHPGEGRTPVSLPHEEFVKLMQEWADQGAACP